MKNLQTWLLKIICSSLLLFFTIVSDAQTEKIRQADSLFKAKQFTQSLEIYQSVFNEKKYSPAMLLKMAYINEGLGKTGATLYYLKLYHLATDDEKALARAEELASKYKLSGYEVNDTHRLKHWLMKNQIIIQAVLAVIVLATSVLLFIQQKQSQKPWAAFLIVLFAAAGLFYTTNFSVTSSVIIARDKAYLMNGPSAGAPVVAVVTSGNLLESFEQNDVWLKVKWLDREAFVKKSDVLMLEL